MGMVMAKTDVAVRVIGGGAALMAGSMGMAQAQDVGGFYAGIGVGANSGDFTAFGSDEYSFEGGTVGSLFAGYNFVSGNMIYGGELAYSNGANTDVDNPYVGEISSLLDLKGRLGTMVGSTMFYGSLGYTRGKMGTEFLGGGGTVSGINLGAGFETSLSDKMFIGGDYTARNLNGGGTVDGVPGEEYMDDVNLSTLSIRLGFRF
ncbi:MAG: porin family protein [Hyphomicrobiales bacterium]|nr:MAG: porin family protein [Hyphomicrobiales bacterium]